MGKSFFEKVEEKFGNKFDLSKVNYEKSTKKVCIVCPEHGEFYTTPVQFLQSKHGCPKCAIKSRSDKQKSTNEEFIQKCISIYGNKFSYDKTKYVNTNSKVIVTCKIHGDFLTRPADFLRGHSCPKCKGDKIANFNKTSKTYTKEEFIEKGIFLYEGLFDYSNVIYVNSRTKVLIHSNLINEDFLITPSKFLQGDIKKKYFGIKTKFPESLNKEIFIQRAKLIHGNLYDYSKVEYKNNKTKVEIICSKHGSFWQIPNNHLLNLQGCPKCSQSKGELIVENVLIDKKINFTKQFPIIIESKNCKIDFMCKYKDKIIFIEYNGKQHYFPVEIFGGQEAFNKQLERDNLVRSYCEKNGIILLEYPYTIPFEKLSTIVKNDLKNIIDNE